MSEKCFSLGYTREGTYECTCGQRFGVPENQMPLEANAQTAIQALRDQWQAHRREAE